MTLRTRLILAFAAVTAVPVALTWWTSVSLLERSLDLAPVREVDELSRALQLTAREVYTRARQQLQSDAAAGKSPDAVYLVADEARWPAAARAFWASGQASESNAAADGTRIELRARSADGVKFYSAPLGPVNLNEVTRQYAKARELVDSRQRLDLRRGFQYTFLLVAGAIWVTALAALVLWTRKLVAPVTRLTAALQSVAAGDLTQRLAEDRADEIGVAVKAYNSMAEQVERSREKLVFVTRLASWQAVARKMAHEVKNSLTPIRLTVEEIAARYSGDSFAQQASQIIVEEVTALERRVRAFSELASEPPVSLDEIDLNALLEERVAFLRLAHPETRYEVSLDGEPARVWADTDLVKGALTNLLENAAQAAGPGGVVKAGTARHNGTAWAEVHDSGPGLSALARSTLFEPSISFKKGGMGLGLSIARRSALLCGGDLSLIEGSLGGAAFRLMLPVRREQPPSNLA